MGLAITRSILKAHDGAIEVQSTAGKGTTLRFWVPLVEKERLEQGQGRETAAGLATGPARGEGLGQALNNSELDQF